MREDWDFEAFLEKSLETWEDYKKAPSSIKKAMKEAYQRLQRKALELKKVLDEVRAEADASFNEAREIAKENVRKARERNKFLRRERDRDLAMEEHEIMKDAQWLRKQGRFMEAHRLEENFKNRKKKIIETSELNLYRDFNQANRMAIERINRANEVRKRRLENVKRNLNAEFKKLVDEVNRWLLEISQNQFSFQPSSLSQQPTQQKSKVKK
mgnify:CR=1 FL=1